MKSVLASKTVWFNLLAVIVIVAGAFGFNEFQPSAEVGQIAVAIVAIINMVLRVWFTREPIQH